MPNVVYRVNFGRSRADLRTVGFWLGAAAWTTSGVSQVVPGWGLYEVDLPEPADPTYLLWGTGDDRPLYAVEDLNPPLATTLEQSVNFGRARAGLETVGHTLFNQARVAPIPERRPGTGIYGTRVTPPPKYRGPILWDSGGASPVYAEASLDLSLAPAVPPPTGLAPDFLSALMQWLNARPALSALFPRTAPGSRSYVPSAGPVSFGLAPSDFADYPYCVLTQTQGPTYGFDSAGDWEEDRFYQFSIFDDDQDRLADATEAMVRELNTLNDIELLFADGYQIDWRPSANLLTIASGVLGMRSDAPVWHQLYTYKAKIIRRRLA